MKFYRTGVVIMLALALAMTGGCAVSGKVKMAESSFQQAENLGAEQKAPYEYYAARAFLALARHEVTEGDGKQAEIFADQASSFAEQAINKSGGGK